MKKFAFKRSSACHIILSVVASCIFTASILAPVWAQDSKPATSASPTLTQRHLDIARDVVILSGLARTFDGMLPTFMDQVRQTYITRPEISTDLNAVLEQLKPEVEERKKDILNSAAKILASRIDEKNMSDIRTFFKSTAGQRYVATQPLVLDDLFAALNNWAGEVSTFLIDRTREEMRKKGHEL